MVWPCQVRQGMPAQQGGGGWRPLGPHELIFALKHFAQVSSSYIVGGHQIIIL